MSRVRSNFITNRLADGAPTASLGLIISGVTTSTTLNVDDKIVHTGDTDTAIRFPAANTFAVDTAGSEKLRITSGGSIGIGTDDPQQDVHILRSQLSRVRIESTSTAYNSDVIFQNPDGLLGVVGYNATLDSINIDSRGGTNGVTITRTGSEKVRITSEGYVGINTNNPLNALEVLGNSSTTDTIAGVTVHEIARFNADTSEKFGLKLALDNTNKVFYLHRSDNGGDLAFSTRTGGANYERFRIKNDGTVLKGLTSPRGNYGNNTSGVEYGVQIEGTSAIAASVSIVRNSNDANDGGIVLGKTRATSNGGNTVVQAGDDLGNLTFAGNDGSTMLFGAEIFAEVQSGVGNDDMPTDLIFKTNGGSTSTTERLRIGSAGYVSGNVNVPAWFGSQDTAHNVANGTWTAIINLGNDVTNPSMNNGGWNESTGIFTVQAGQAGTYYVFGQAGIDDIQGDDIVRVGISKNNGTPNFFGECRAFAGESNQIYQAYVAMVITVAETDTIRLKVYHNEGTTEPTEPNRCYFGGYRIAV